MSIVEPNARENRLKASRAGRLRNAIHTTHERLDVAVMAMRPLDSREAYAGFLAVQYLFHRDIAPLYESNVLQRFIPDLADRGRLSCLVQDHSDLELSVPQEAISSNFAGGGEPDLASAPGWLYVAESFSLGAAFLLKFAARLGLSETFGARHLAGDPVGRGLNWRRFTQALDAVPLTSEKNEERVVAGAQAAFRRVRELIAQHATIQDCDSGITWIRP